MKRIKTVLMIAMLVLAFSTVALGAPADLVGKAYTPALAQQLTQEYGPAQKAGSDNKHGFVYFQGGDFTLAVLIHNKVIVKVIDGTY